MTGYGYLFDQVLSSLTASEDQKHIITGLKVSVCNSWMFCNEIFGTP